jgi:integrase
MATPFRIEGKSGWWIRFTDEFGKRRKKCFEAHEEAATALALEKARVIEVRRGQRDPTPPTKRYEDVADYWAEFKVPQKRSGTDDLSIMRAHLRPFFGGMKLADIGVETVDRYLAEKKGLSKKTVNNHLTLLITQLNLAHELRWIHRAPRIKKPKIRLFDTDYDYLRTADEIRRFLDAAEREGELVHACYSTATFTGAREGEIAALTWDDINFETRLITIQRSFDGPTKAGDARYVPILDVLLPVLRRWRLRCPGKLVFPNANGGMQCESARIFQEVLHRVLDAAGFPKFLKPNGKFRYYVTFHDLRHSFASLWVMNGGDIFKLQKLLGHKSIAMTMRYAHLAPAAYAGDLSRFGTALRMNGELLHLPAQDATAPLQEPAPNVAAPTS